MNEPAGFKGATEAANGKRGVVLVTCLLLLGMLSLFALSLYRTQRPELISSVYQRREREAFYQAEAGAHYVVSRISQDFAAQTITLADPVESVHYSCISNYNFDTVRELIRLPSEDFLFMVTGHAFNARCIMEVTVGRKELTGRLGLFGDLQINLQPNMSVYSYNSAVVSNPTPADSTGEACVGSNEDFDIQPGLTLDGMFVAGASEMGTVPATPEGYDVTYAGRIEPDPLGALSSTGLMGRAFTYFSTHNQNATGITISSTKGKTVTTTTMSGTKINAAQDDVVTLQGGTYYLTQFDMGVQTTLVLSNATPQNPVVIYLAGGMWIQPQQVINPAATGGKPTNFYIFSNSAEDLRIQPQGDFSGFVYAPGANLQLQPSLELHGVFWGDTTTLQPGGNVYIDTALLERFRSSNVEIKQWRALY